MGTTHFIERCTRCGIVMSQCRCPSPDKEVRYGICEGCKADGYQATCPNANVEQVNGNAPHVEDFFEKETARVSIHVRSHRRINTDPDGVSAKAALDGIVARGILADDSSKQVSSFTSEVITGRSTGEEETHIIITQEINNE